MFEPVKVGFGGYLARFYPGVSSSTKPLQEFITRGFDKCFLWAPGRMIDKVDEVLAAWQKNDTYQADTSPYRLPVVIAILDDNYNPAPLDFTYQVTDSQPVILEGDDKSRLFGVKTITAQLRFQIAIIATDQPTALSMASQMQLFFKHPGNRRFTADYRFAGVDNQWPAQMVDNQIEFLAVDAGGLKNLRILAANLFFNVLAPVYDAPAINNPNQDELGIPGTNDPAGYMTVNLVDSKDLTP